MHSRYHHIVFIFFALAAIISCGGGGGAPGSTGSGDTGIMIKSVNATTESPDIDTFQNLAACGTPPLLTPEQPLTAARATLSIVTENLTPTITSSQFPASIEECTISYRKANEDPASPIIESLTIYPNCTLKEGDNTCGVMLIDIARKQQYALPVIVNGTSSPSEYPTHYVAIYACRYTNNFGKSGYFQTELDIWLADWLSC